MGPNNFNLDNSARPNPVMAGVIPPELENFEIAVVESSVVVQVDQRRRKVANKTVAVFNIIVEDRNQILSLVRYIPDFIDFDQKLHAHYRKVKIQLPTLTEPSERDAKRRSLKNLLSTLSNIKGTKSNAEKVEQYLRKCAVDPTIRFSSLFRDFFSVQREDDHAAPKEAVQTYVTRQAMLMEEQMQQLQQAAKEGPVTSPSVAARVAKRSLCDDPRDEQMMNDVADIDKRSPKLLKKSSNGLKNSISSGTSEQTVRAAVPSKKAEKNEEPPKKVSIQDFQLIKVLGKGCMGKVLLVREHKTGRLLALKAISKEWVIMQREIEHTKTERDILANVAAVDHPFLIKLHHSFQSASQLFLVLDYYVGGDIATQLAKWHKFEADRCKLYAAEILLGMQELHRQGIVYRDLKPENILLSSDGHLVLTDFGLSKQFYPTGEEKTTTFCGTAEYLAPEILRAEEYSYEVDYWSLGTLLYEMLTGITPFWAENHADMYRRVLEDELEFPEDFDPVTADFIAGLLERDPESRLGAGPNGEQDIKSHPYFEGMSWDDIYNKRYTPPYVPDLHSETDFSNFDDAFLMMTPRLSPTPGNVTLTNSIQDVFQGYSFTEQTLAGQDADDDDDEDVEYEDDEDQQVPVAAHQSQSASELQSRYTQQLDDDMEEEEDYYYSNEQYPVDEYDDYEESALYSRKRSNLNLEPDSDDSDSEDEYHEQERKRSAKKRHTLGAEAQFDYAFDQQLSESLMFSQPSSHPQSATDALSSASRQNGARSSNMVSPSVVQMVPDFGNDDDNLEFPVHQSMYEYPTAAKKDLGNFTPAPAHTLKHKKSSVLVY